MGKPPRFRLVPNNSGSYTLEKWAADVCMYLSEAVQVTPEQADEKIKSLDREVIYYREGS
jgi:hypothetical protein